MNTLYALNDRFVKSTNPLVLVLCGIRSKNFQHRAVRHLRAPDASTVCLSSMRTEILATSVILDSIFCTF
jgi:hypothetical protein